MPFVLKFTTDAKARLHGLEHDADKKDLVKFKRIRSCVGKLQLNPRHPGLNSHRFEELKGPGGEDVWESYVENKAPAAWRVFWHYGPGQACITVIAITPHP